MNTKPVRPKLLFGKEYEVECEDFEEGNLGWFHAKYMTSRARNMDWLWEITDPRFKYDGEVSIIDWRLPTDRITATERSGG